MWVSKDFTPCQCEGITLLQCLLWSAPVLTQATKLLSFQHKHTTAELGFTERGFTGTLPNDSTEPFRLLSAKTLTGDKQLICFWCFTALEQMDKIWITLTVSQ